jgi:thymidylate synthase (FAD)
MVNCVFEIETTRDIARQILRHRSFSFQEFIQRNDYPTNLGWETREARLQDKKNRQNSIELNMEDVEELDLAFDWDIAQENVMRHALKQYKWAIENGIAKEQARALLPEGLTTSRMYMNGTLRSWIHYIKLRSGNGTQKEHQEIAIECSEIIKKIFPMIDELM